MKRSRIALFLAFLILSVTFTVDAYPTRAGHCESGAEIGEASGGVHGRIGSGILGEGNFTISVNGTVLDGDEVLELVAGENYTVIVDGSAPFRGVLLRISGINGEEMQDSLQVIDNTTQLLLSTGEKSGFESACAEDVAGLCHNSRADKNNITTELMVQEDSDVLVEVTIVTNNDGGGSNDWYYESYQLNVRSTNGTTNNTTNSTIDEESSPDSEDSSTNSTTNSTIKDESSDSENEEVYGEAEFPPYSACKWYCSVIPTPWLSQEPEDHPKCDWMYSCSACDECQNQVRNI